VLNTKSQSQSVVSFFRGFYTISFTPLTVRLNSLSFRLDKLSPCLRLRGRSTPVDRADNSRTFCSLRGTKLHPNDGQRMPQDIMANIFSAASSFGCPRRQWRSYSTLWAGVKLGWRASPLFQLINDHTDIFE